MPAEPLTGGTLSLPDVAERPVTTARAGRLPVFSLGIIGVFVLVALLAPFISPADPTEQSLRNRFKPPAWMEGGSGKYLLGTDRLGRDMLSRIVWGSRVSISAGVVTPFSTKRPMCSRHSAGEPCTSSSSTTWSGMTSSARRTRPATTGARSACSWRWLTTPTAIFFDRLLAYGLNRSIWASSFSVASTVQTSPFRRLR